MNLKTTIQVLELHNRWRKGEDMEMQNPETLGKALETAIDFLKSHSTQTPDDVIKAFTQ